MKIGHAKSYSRRDRHLLFYFDKYAVLFPYDTFDTCIALGVEYGLVLVLLGGAGKSHDFRALVCSSSLGACHNIKGKKEINIPTCFSSA